MIENEMRIEEKIRKLGTKIIGRTKEYLLIEKKLKEIYGNKNIILKLIYKGTRDGDDAKSFHSKCDDLKGSLIVIKSDEEIIFGGFTQEKWSGDCVFKLDDTSFLFSFYPLKIYEIKKNKKAIFCNKKYGPSFGSVTLVVNDNFLINGGWCCSSYLSNFENYDNDYEINNGINEFKIQEMEIYQVIAE